MSDTYDFISTFMGLLMDAGSWLSEHAKNAADYLRSYCADVWRLAKRFAVATAIPIPILAICLAFGWHVNWLYSIYWVFVGIEAFVLMAFAFPLITAARIVLQKLPTLQREVFNTARVIAGAAFWALLVAVYFYIFPVWQNPSWIPVVFLCAAALAFGGFAGWTSLTRSAVKKTNTIFLIAVLVLATLAFTLPGKMRQMGRFMHHMDEDSLTPLKIESPEQIRFVNAEGVPQLWYYRSPSGEYELYDHEGFHRSGEQLKLAETSEDRNQIIAWFTEQARKRAAEQKTLNNKSSSSGGNSTGFSPGGGQGPAMRPPSIALPPGGNTTDGAARQRLISATTAGATYVGTVRTQKDTIRPIKLVFTEQTGSMIRAELSNPDNGRQKRALLGELRDRPQPAEDGAAGYAIVLNPATKGTEFIGINVDLIGGLYTADWGDRNALQLRLTDKGLDGEALKHRGDLSSGDGLTLHLESKGFDDSVTKTRLERSGLATREKLIQATAQGASYIGTFTCDDSCLGKTPYVGRLRLVFTEQKDFVISVEATSPDDSEDKVTFTGELRFNALPEQNGAQSYPIALSPVRGERSAKRGLFGRGMWSNNVRLRLVDGGLEGEADSSGKSTTIRLVREGASSGEQPKAEHGADHRKLLSATAKGASYLGTFTCDDSCLGKTPYVGRLRLVFLDQNDFVISAEATNPDDRQDKVTFAGELRFDPLPETDGAVAYHIAMSPVRGERYAKRGIFGRGMWSNSIRLRLTDKGLEGEADSSGKSTTINLLCETSRELAATSTRPSTSPAQLPGIESSEIKASKQLSLARLYLENNESNMKAKGKEILAGIIRDFPQTQVAKDAKAELGKLR